MQHSSVIDLIPQPQRLLLSEVIGSFSYTLDMGEAATPGHSLRCCWLGMQIGQSLSYSEQQLWDLYYTLLLKDLGGSSISSKLTESFFNDDRLLKSRLKLIDFKSKLNCFKFLFKYAFVNSKLIKRFFQALLQSYNHKQILNEIYRTRAECGASFAIQLGFNDNIADAIHSLNEHWDGQGYSDGICEQVIPANSQIVLIAELFDNLYQEYGYEEALIEIKGRELSWFNPEFVNIITTFLNVSENKQSWESFKSDSVLKQSVYELEPGTNKLSIDDDRLDDIAIAFAQIVDAKSENSRSHSTRVALYTDAIANELGLSVERRRWLYRAALLHDVGNMGLSNLILDKKSELSTTEWQESQSHTRKTFELLQHLQSFKELAKVASSHHERLDGKGYPKGNSEFRISLETRIISIANMFDSLLTDKSYKKAMTLANVLRVMEKQCDISIDRDCLNAFKVRIPSFDTISK